MNSVNSWIEVINGTLALIENPDITIEGSFY